MHLCCAGSAPAVAPLPHNTAPQAIIKRPCSLSLWRHEDHLMHFFLNLFFSPPPLPPFLPFPSLPSFHPIISQALNLKRKIFFLTGCIGAIAVLYVHITGVMEQAVCVITVRPSVTCQMRKIIFFITSYIYIYKSHRASVCVCALMSCHCDGVHAAFAPCHLLRHQWEPPLQEHSLFTKVNGVNTPAGSPPTIIVCFPPTL